MPPVTIFAILLFCPIDFRVTSRCNPIGPHLTLCLMTGLFGIRNWFSAGCCWGHNGLKRVPCPRCWWRKVSVSSLFPSRRQLARCGCLVVIRSCWACYLIPLGWGGSWLAECACVCVALLLSRKKRVVGDARTRRRCRGAAVALPWRGGSDRDRATEGSTAEPGRSWLGI